MTSHWLSEDGQRAIEIIGPVTWRDLPYGKMRLVRGPDQSRFGVESYRSEDKTWSYYGWLCESIGQCILDHHAEHWLHERHATVVFSLSQKLWMRSHRGPLDAGTEFTAYPSKSQTLIAAVLAAEGAI